MSLDATKVPGIIEWHQLDKGVFYSLGAPYPPPKPCLTAPGPLAQLITRYFVYPMNLVKTRIQVE
jgi:hypothetical protein